MKYLFSTDNTNLIVTLDTESGKYNPEITTINDPNITLENDRIWFYENGKYIRNFSFDHVGTISGVTPTSIADAFAKLNVVIDGLYLLVSPNFKGSIVPTDTPTGTEDAVWIATQQGTYTNHGNVVVNANSRAEISRVSGVFSISQTPLDISGKVNVSDVINNLTSTETAKPGSANNDRLLNAKIKNYPIKETGLVTQGSNAPSNAQMQDFLVELYLTGNYNSDMTYSAFNIQRNLAGVWKIYILGKPSASAAVEICQFSTTINPEQGDKVTFHALTQLASSGVTGTIAVNWSKIPLNVNYYNMYDASGYGFDLKVWDKSNATLINQNELPLASKIITTDQITVQNIVQRDSSLSIDNLKINPISYKHPRGDSEYTGTGNLTSLEATCAILAPQGKRTLVKSVKAKFYASSAFSGTMAIYKNTTLNANNILNTLVESFPIALGTFNSDENGFQTITLSNDLILEANEYLYFYAFANTSTLSMKRWGNDSGVAPLRTGLVYKFSGSWTTNGSTAYMAVPMLVYSDVNDTSQLASQVAALSTQVALKADDDFLAVNLPDAIYAVVGDKLQLFFRGILPSVNPYNYNIVTNCTKGNQYRRYFEYTPVIGDVGTTTLTITVKNNSGKILGSKVCNLITKNIVQSPSTNKNAIIVGDSLINNGAIAKEVQRRLTGSGGSPVANALTNIAFKGRMNDGGAVGWEGTGGWNWYNYTIEGGLAYKFTVSGITNVPTFGTQYTNNGQTFTVAETNVTAGSGTIRCTATGAPAASGTLTRIVGYEDATIAFSASQVESLNPFWNAGALNFNNYVTTYMGGSVDAVYFLLSWNGLTPNKTDFASIITTAKILVDHIKISKPSIKIKIMGVQLPSLNGGMGYAYGANGGYADTFGMSKTILNMNTAYQSWCNEGAYSSFMEFVNVSSQFDSENNMPEADKVVNSRSAKTEKVGTNGVHPSTEGYYQIADVVYRNVVKEFCQ